MSLPSYYINFDENEFESGINAIAITSSPAIETLALRFKRDFKFKVDSEKRIIVGAAMIPDKKIYREDENGDGFYVIFTKEVIERMVKKFNNEKRNIVFNYEHNSDLPIEGFINESWIVEDKTYDKSRLYGFDVPIGSWMISAKIEDVEVWDILIKNMDTVGFSIEGLMGVDFINKFIKKEAKMKKKRLFAKKVNKASKKRFNVKTRKFETVEISKEDEVLIIEGDTLEEGIAVEILDENADTQTAEDGTYELPAEEVVIEVVDGVIESVDELTETEEVEMEEETPAGDNVDYQALLDRIAQLEIRVDELASSVANADEPEVFSEKKNSVAKSLAALSKKTK